MSLDSQDIDNATGLCTENQLGSFQNIALHCQGFGSHFLGNGLKFQEKCNIS
jgi:hypothetical protein